jgi:hypothetical protein
VNPTISQRETAEAPLRRQLDTLRRSADPTDQVLLNRFEAGCKLAMRASKLHEASAPNSPHRARIEKLVAECGERVAEDIAKIGERASWLAEATPRQRERRRNFERVCGMSPEERWRYLHRGAYRIARRHGADPLQAQSFALESLHRPRTRTSGPVHIGRSRARRQGHSRRRGSRRSTGSGSRAGPDGDGDSDEPARGRQLIQGGSSPSREARRFP